MREVRLTIGAQGASKSPLRQTPVYFHPSLTALSVAEYVPEVVPGEILGLEAVVVSDLPGGQGQGVRVLDTTGKYVAQEGAGHGWAEAARSALLMASATFLEEVLDMRSVRYATKA